MTHGGWLCHHPLTFKNLVTNASSTTWGIFKNFCLENFRSDFIYRVFSVQNSFSDWKLESIESFSGNSSITNEITIFRVFATKIFLYDKYIKFHKKKHFSRNNPKYGYMVISSSLKNSQRNVLSIPTSNLKTNFGRKTRYIWILINKFLDSIITEIFGKYAL